MERRRSLARFCAFALFAITAFVLPAGASEDTTLDAQIEHGASLCEGSAPQQKVFGLVPPGFDYRFRVASAPDVRAIAEMHLTLAAGWEKSFRRSVISGAAASELKRELRLAGSNGAASLLASESQIDGYLKEYKPGKPVIYEVALLGCAGSSGSFDAIMALKEFEVEAD